MRGCNDLGTTHLKIAREWGEGRNGGSKPTDMIANSDKRAWWKRREGRERSSLIAHRTKAKNGDPSCPYCTGRKVLASYNNLAATRPDVAAMWHPRMSVPNGTHGGAGGRCAD